VKKLDHTVKDNLLESEKMKVFLNGQKMIQRLENLIRESWKSNIQIKGSLEKENKENKG
jgi:hypothetical protein